MVKIKQNERRKMEGRKSDQQQTFAASTNNNHQKQQVVNQVTSPDLFELANMAEQVANQPQLKQLDQMPLDAVSLIVDYLDPKSLIALSQTSSIFYNICSAGYFWKNLLLRDFKNEFAMTKDDLQNLEDKYKRKINFTLLYSHCYALKQHFNLLPQYIRNYCYDPEESFSFLVVMLNDAEFAKRHLPYSEYEIWYRVSLGAKCHHVAKMILNCYQKKSKRHEHFLKITALSGREDMFLEAQTQFTPHQDPENPIDNFVKLECVEEVVRSGNLKMIKQFFKTYPDHIDEFMNDETVFCYYLKIACLTGKPQVLKYLLESCLVINMKPHSDSFEVVENKRFVRILNILEGGIPWFMAAFASGDLVFIKFVVKLIQESDKCRAELASYTDSENFNDENGYDSDNDSENEEGNHHSQQFAWVSVSRELLLSGSNSAIECMRQQGLFDDEKVDIDDLEIVIFTGNLLFLKNHLQKNTTIVLNINHLNAAALGGCEEMFDFVLKHLNNQVSPVLPDHTTLGHAAASGNVTLFRRLCDQYQLVPTIATLNTCLNGLDQWFEDKFSYLKSSISDMNGYFIDQFDLPPTLSFLNKRNCQGQFEIVRILNEQFNVNFCNIPQITTSGAPIVPLDFFARSSVNIKLCQYLMINPSRYLLIQADGRHSNFVVRRRFLHCAKSLNDAIKKLQGAVFGELTASEKERLSIAIDKAIQALPSIAFSTIDALLHLDTISDPAKLFLTNILKAFHDQHVNQLCEREKIKLESLLSNLMKRKTDKVGNDDNLPSPKKFKK